MWREIPLRIRLAVGGALAQGVLRLFSDEFRQAYRQQFALDVVWQYVDGIGVSETTVRQTYDEGGPVFDRAESQGYHYHEVCIPFSLLEEILVPDGKGMSNEASPQTDEL